MEGTGHVDVFAKLATPGTVLVTEPRSVVNGRRPCVPERPCALRTGAGPAPCVPKRTQFGLLDFPAGFIDISIYLLE